MIKVIDFQPEHLEQISPKACHTGEVPKTVMTYAFTLTSEGKPVAIFGFFAFIPGVFHIWGYLSEEVRKMPLSFHKACLSVMQFYSERFQARRLQMDVRADYAEGIRWAESLGFKCEGVMKNFGLTGMDHCLMGRAL